MRPASSRPPAYRPHACAESCGGSETYHHQYWDDWALAPIRSNVKTYSACCEACAANPACLRFSVWSSKPSPCRMFNTSALPSSLVTVSGVPASTVLGSSQSESEGRAVLVLPRGAAQQRRPLP